jgi:hypothetical protein
MVESTNPTTTRPRRMKGRALRFFHAKDGPEPREAASMFRIHGLQGREYHRAEVLDEEAWQ